MQSINRAWVSSVVYILYTYIIYYLAVKTNKLDVYILTWKEFKSKKKLHYETHSLITHKILRPVRGHSHFLRVILLWEGCKGRNKDLNFICNLFFFLLSVLKFVNLGSRYLLHYY